VIVLDTNVVSEPLRRRPDKAVVDWLDGQDAEALYLTTVTVAELLVGLEALPKGRRRTALQHAVREGLLPRFHGRILPFDQRAAEAFALIDLGARAAGNTISFADAAIAAVAASKGFIVATRNARDFRGTQVKLLDPWSAGASA
jgi:hypothetical protein